MHDPKTAYDVDKLTALSVDIVDNLTRPIGKTA